MISKGEKMEIDRYCNNCLSFYRFDVDEDIIFEKCSWCGSNDTEEV